MAQRIAIIGTSGAGKTTLGRELARRIEGDFIEVDALAHKANWVNATDEELCTGIDAAMAGTDRGVIDGTFRRRLGDFVTARTDLIVWRDLPLTTILPRLLCRTDYGVPRILPPAELERYCELIAALNVRTRHTQGRHLSTPEAGHLIALTGITGCGKTTTARRIRQDLDKERKILVATNLAVDKERVKLGTLMTAIVADISTDKEATLPTQAELRERRLRDLIQRRGRPVALFIDEAHDLHPKTMVGLTHLVEVVQEGGAILAIVLVGLPRLRVNLRRPAMEEIGARVTMLTLESLQGSGLSFLTWLLERCKRPEVAITDIFTEEAMTMLVDRLTTPLQLIHYAWRALEEAYVAGQKPVDAKTVHDVLVPDLDSLEPRWTRLGYPIKSLCEALNARPAEIRAFLHGRLSPRRMQELHQELLKLGVVA